MQLWFGFFVTAFFLISCDNFGTNETILDRSRSSEQKPNNQGNQVSTGKSNGDKNKREVAPPEISLSLNSASRDKNGFVYTPNNLPTIEWNVENTDRKTNFFRYATSEEGLHSAEATSGTKFSFVSELRPGWHKFFIQFLDKSEGWSKIFSLKFYVMPNVEEIKETWNAGFSSSTHGDKPSMLPEIKLSWEINSLLERYECSIRRPGYINDFRFNCDSEKPIIVRDLVKKISELSPLSGRLELSLVGIDRVGREIGGGKILVIYDFQTPAEFELSLPDGDVHTSTKETQVALYWNRELNPLDEYAPDQINYCLQTSSDILSCEWNLIPDGFFDGYSTYSKNIMVALPLSVQENERIPVYLWRKSSTGNISQPKIYSFVYDSIPPANGSVSSSTHPESGQSYAAQNFQFTFTGFTDSSSLTYACYIFDSDNTVKWRDLRCTPDNQLNVDLRPIFPNWRSMDPAGESMRLVIRATDRASNFVDLNSPFQVDRHTGNYNFRLKDHTGALIDENSDPIVLQNSGTMGIANITETMENSDAVEFCGYRSGYYENRLIDGVPNNCDWQSSENGLGNVEISLSTADVGNNEKFRVVLAGRDHLGNLDYYQAKTVQMQDQ